MAYQIAEINRRITTDPEKFVADCDARYEAVIMGTASNIADNLEHSPIVLLAGPSGSGKTTSAHRLEDALLTLGIRSHVISMDNYFLTVSPELTPLTEDGKYDFESPLCIDMPRLQDHFDKLSRGEEIMVPYFDFMVRQQDLSRSTPLKLEKDEVVIFEGIHALNSEITGDHPEAMKLFVSAESDVLNGDRLLFPDEWARFVRRLVRDFKFRNTTAGETIDMWDNVRRGELKYIRPFLGNANIFIDTAHAYDVPILSRYAIPLLEELPQNRPEYEDYLWLPDVLQRFEPLDEKYIKPQALVREFIGGGIYN